MKHFRTKKMRNGMYGLALAGTLMACDGVLNIPGKIWTERTSPITASSFVRDVAINDNIVLVIGSNGVVARSVDKGKTWGTYISNPFATSHYYISSIAFSNGVAIIGGEYGKISRSTDFGVTWSAYITNPFSTAGQSISRMFSQDGIVFALGNGKISRSTDFGVTWSAFITNPFGTSTLYAVFKNGNTVLIGGASGKIAKSVDGGLTWGSLITTHPFGVYGITGLCYDNGILVAVGSSGKISRSFDEGETWSSLIANPFGTDAIWDIAGYDGIFIIVGSSGKIARSSNGGETWEEPGIAQSYQPFGSSGTYESVIISNERVIVVGNNSEDGIIITSDWIESGAGIVERGDTANGVYIKFSDGTLVQYGIITNLAMPFIEYYGHYLNVTGKDLPMAFVGEYSVISSAHVNSIGMKSAVTVQDTASSFYAEIWKTDNALTSYAVFSWIAIGRWI